MLAEEYVAYVMMSAILVGVVGIALDVVFLLLTQMIGVSLSLFLIPIMIVLPVILAYFIYALMMGSPASKAKERGRNMEKKLPFAMNFISAMASADVTLGSIFKSLSREKVYGEIAKEAGWITREVDVLGKDIITALREAVDRSPSIMFQDFLQGVITTVSSGGRLKPYFVLKSEQYMEEHKMNVKKFNDFVGLMAESFVTVVVVMPLLLIVMLSVMGLMTSGGGGGSTSIILYIIAFVMIPMAQFGFIFIIKIMSPEVG
jgi:flagellar protein FlaJ